MAPFGFIDDGLEDDTIIDETGNIWTVDMNEKDPDKWKMDEYGDRSFMWDYR